MYTQMCHQHKQRKKSLSLKTNSEIILGHALRWLSRKGVAILCLCLHLDVIDRAVQYHTCQCGHRVVFALGYVIETLVNHVDPHSPQAIGDSTCSQNCRTHQTHHIDPYSIAFQHALMTVESLSLSLPSVKSPLSLMQSSLSLIRESS
eukprot:Blabericola_migrator_1__1306@NODE_133_length_13242_cov_100_720987_g17_i1_p9_GENE_NODE_133_length_13242_cov_100_720987_g17_i1NODE_133_length_13242_cov_100_720987_g17_i1_p9_ORF_typecomplete_len148_score6_26Prismane/PF03063_20/0_17_NODE_133_length_13242_cov_100_720987_g17_i134883931